VHRTHNSGQKATVSLILYYLIEEFFVNKRKDIILECSVTFSDRYGMRSTISAVCDFYKDNVNKEQLQAKYDF